MASESAPDGGAWRNTALADGLQTRDIAAVAFALRHGPTVVPLAEAGDESVGEDAVWTYRDADTDEVVLLLFSDIAHMPASLPPGVALLPPAALRAVLQEARADEISIVFLDVAGPHPMRATPAEIVKALDA